MQNRHTQKDAGKQATLGEIFATAVVDGAPTGFALAQMHGTDKPLLWVQDRLSRREAGCPYLAWLYPVRDIIRAMFIKGFVLPLRCNFCLLPPTTRHPYEDFL